jgi:mandelate racemase
VTTTIRDLTVRAVDVPMKRPLSTSARVIDRAPLLLLDVRTEDGVVGRAYLFCFDVFSQGLLRETLAEIAPLLAGVELDAAAIEAQLDRRFRLVGARGLTGMALSGVDTAVWDALGQLAGKPLVRLLGGAPRAIPAYNSNGLGIMGPRGVALEAEELVAEGFSSIKLRLGYDSVERDLEAVHWARAGAGADVEILTDYNQLLTPDEARIRLAALDDRGLGWVEEPIAHDDIAACAELTRTTKTPIQIGENFMGPHAARQALDLHASDLVMFDLQRIGGVSGWLAAAKHAERAQIPASSHLFPEVSVHLMCVTPTADRLEFVDWAAPILAEPLVVSNGFATPSEVPGTGVRWNEAAVKQYLV